jgi:tetratricopeptide (TPR) repeat protein
MIEDTNNQGGNSSFNLQNNESSNVIDETLENILNKYNELLNEIKILREQGDKFHTYNKIDEAKKNYEQALEKLNNFKIDNLSKYDKNSNILNNINKIEELKKTLYGNLSICYYNKKEYQQAINIVNKILTEIDPDHVLSYLRILTWNIELKNIDEANRIAEEIKQKFENNEEILKKFDECFKNLNYLKDSSKYSENGYLDNLYNYFPHILIGGIIVSATLYIAYKYMKK